MKHKIFISIIMILLACSSVFPLQIKTSDQTEYKEDGYFEEDYMYGGKGLVFTGTAKDLYFAGRKLNFKGNTLSGVHAVGETIVIDGNIENDLIAAAGKLEINGAVAGTVFASGGECIFSNDSIINGTLFAGCGNIKLMGTVNGDVYAGAGVITIDGVINGNVKAGAGDIVITDKGKVSGNFDYSTENKLNSNEENRIAGTISFKKFEKYRNFKKVEIIKFLNVMGIIFTILSLLCILGTGLLLLLVPALREFNHAQSNKQFWTYLLWGLIPFFIYPMVIIVAMVLIITIPLGFIIMLAGLPLLLVTLILGITAFGQYLFMLFKWKNSNRFLYFLFGFVFFLLISLIPYVKILGVMFFSCVGWGIILEKISKNQFVKDELSTEQV